MRPSKQRESAHWLWKEYLSVGKLSYLESAVHTDEFYLHPTNVDGSLLSLAIEHRDLPAIKLLTELGAETNVPSSLGYPYLHIAIEGKENQSAIVEILLNSGADPTANGILWT